MNVFRHAISAVRHAEKIVLFVWQVEGSRTRVNTVPRFQFSCNSTESCHRANIFFHAVWCIFKDNPSPRYPAFMRHAYLEVDGTEPFLQYTWPAKGFSIHHRGCSRFSPTLRGRGWGWSRSVYIPPDIRRTDHRRFTFRVLRPGVIHAARSSEVFFTRPSGHSLQQGSEPGNVRPILHLGALRLHPRP